MLEDVEAGSMYCFDIRRWHADAAASCEGHPSCNAALRRIEELLPFFECANAEAHAADRSRCQCVEPIGDIVACPTPAVAVEEKIEKNGETLVKSELGSLVVFRNPFGKLPDTWAEAVEALDGWSRPKKAKSRSQLNRVTIWQTLGECCCDYSYGGMTSPAGKAVAAVLDVSAAVADFCDLPWILDGPSGVVLNAYTRNEDGVGWHADAETRIRAASADIVSLSLGASRVFEARTNDETDVVAVRLDHGDVCIMSGAFQHHYQHRVLPRDKADHMQAGTRYNLSWRPVTQHESSCPLGAKPNAKCGEHASKAI